MRREVTVTYASGENHSTVQLQLVGDALDGHDQSVEQIEPVGERDKADEAEDGEYLRSGDGMYHDGTGEEKTNNQA